MKVDFDGLRNNLIREYNSLCQKLNENRDSDGAINLEPWDISREMDAIRSMIVTLGCLYSEEAGIGELKEFEVSLFNEE